jgi:hypothetical protein
MEYLAPAESVRPDLNRDHALRENSEMAVSPRRYTRQEIDEVIDQHGGWPLVGSTKGA